MPTNSNTENLSLDTEDWEIALVPYCEDPGTLIAPLWRVGQSDFCGNSPIKVVTIIYEAKPLLSLIRACLKSRFVAALPP